jgi:hypothetical protein
MNADLWKSLSVQEELDEEERTILNSLINEAIENQKLSSKSHDLSEADFVRKRTDRKFTPQEKKLAIKLRKLGHFNLDISLLYNISPGTISKWCKPKVSTEKLKSSDNKDSAININDELPHWDDDWDLDDKNLNKSREIARNKQLPKSIQLPLSSKFRPNDSTEGLEKLETHLSKRVNDVKNNVADVTTISGRTDFYSQNSNIDKQIEIELGRESSIDDVSQVGRLESRISLLEKRLEKVIEENELLKRRLDSSSMSDDREGTVTGNKSPDISTLIQKVLEQNEIINKDLDYTKRICMRIDNSWTESTKIRNASFISEEVTANPSADITLHNQLIDDKSESSSSTYILLKTRTEPGSVTNLSMKDYHQVIYKFDPNNRQFVAKMDELKITTSNAYNIRTKKPSIASLDSVAEANFRLSTLKEDHDLYGYRCEYATGDGNCLYRTFSVLSTGSEEDHKRVRYNLLQMLIDPVKLLEVLQLIYMC